MPEKMPNSPTLRQAAVSGAKWTSGSAAVAFVAQLIQITILARLLGPADIGLAAMVLVVINFANAFADAGISNAIIARQTSERTHLSSLFWTSVLAGIAVCTAVVAATPLIADFYGEPRLNDLVPLAAVVFLLVPTGQQFQALFQKELAFRTLATAEALSAITGAGVAVITAAAGAGPAALIWGRIATAAAKSSILAAKGWGAWRPMARLRRDDLRGYVGFGTYQMGFQSVNFLATNIDYIIIGRLLGPSALGAYTLAYQIVVRPQVQLNPILTRVAFPVFARRQSDDAALRGGFLELTRLLALLAFPFLVGVAITAPQLVPVIFGDRWDQAVPLVQILAILGASKSLGNPMGSLLLAKSRPDIGFYVNLVLLVAVAGLVYAGATQGLVEASWGHVVAALLVFTLNRFMLRFLVGLSATSYLRSLRKPAAMAAVMASVVLVATFVIDGLLADGPLYLGLQVFVGAATYGVLVWRFDRPYVRELWMLLRARGARD